MSLKRLGMLFSRRASGHLENGEKIALFLGAGADIASGGLSFRELKKVALEHYAEIEPSIAASEELIDHRFQQLFESIDTPSERANLIETVFRLNQELIPSDAYRMLVLLAQQGAVDVIVTTNFDSMLEAAQAEMGVTAIQTFAAGLARPFPMHEKYFQDSSRVPYIKMHGCISSRSVTHITSDELENPKYEPSLLQLLKDKLANAHIVFLGYSGYDPGLAKAVRTSFSKHRASLYFCNPTPPNSDAPLVEAAGGLQNFVVVETDFDGAIDRIAKPILQRPFAVSSDKVFIENLFHWRVDYASQEFQNAHPGLSKRGSAPEIVRRQAAEQQIEQFLLSEKPLAVVVGQSGYGKSTLGVRIRQLFQTNDTSVLLVSANSFVGTDFEDEIVRKLDGAQFGSGGGLQALETILRRRLKRLIVVIDGLNEFDSDLQRSAQLFKSVLRFCAYAPENSCVRIVTTIRSDSWAAFQRLVNHTDLERAMSAPDQMPGSVAAIGLGKLSEAEFDDALTRINRQQGTNYDRRRMAPAIRDLLQDPFFLSIAVEERLDGWMIGASAASFEKMMRKRVERTHILRSSDEVMTALAMAALDVFKRSREIVDHSLIRKHFPEAALLRHLKDVAIFADAGNGTVRFSHDRTFEFFLARGFDLATGPSIASPEELLNAIQEFEPFPKAMAALHMNFLINSDQMLKVIDDALKLSSMATGSPWAAAHQSKVLEFCLHFLADLAVDQPKLLARRFDECVEECKLGVRDLPQLLPYLRAAAFLPHETTIAVLPKLEHVAEPTTSFVVEAHTHVIDKVVEIFLERGETSVDLLKDPLFGPYFADKSVDLYRRLGRILGLASQLGPDNLHPQEYQTARKAILNALTDTVSEGVPDIELEKFATFIRAGKDRYLFNASENGIDNFFANPGRSAFVHIFDRLADGGCLEPNDFDLLVPYIDSFDFDLEFQLGNFLFIISSLNDFDKTLSVWLELFSKLDNRSHPNFFDFLQGTIPYIYVINNREYDDFLAAPTDKVLSDMPAFVRFHPGNIRGFARGYTDPYDQVFEDGFNPIACYGFLAPSNLRRSMRWEEYTRTNISEGVARFPVYERHLRHFLEIQDEVAAIRIIHALGQLCILWPREGLPALRALLGTSNVRIRRAVLRVLAETYSRYPVETQNFLEASGSLVSDREIQKIRIADGNVGKRQFEGLQWARVLHYLFQFPGAKSAFLDALRIAYTAQSMEEAIGKIALALGLSTQGEK